MRLTTVLAVVVGLAATAAGFVGPAAAQSGSADVQALDAPVGATVQETNETDEEKRFDVDAELVGSCGERCRTVTANLTNTGNDTAENVTTVTTIETGATEIWDREDEVGTLSANESVERTTDVNIGYLDAYRIVQNDGEITINTTVYWDGGNETFIENRTVG